MFVGLLDGQDDGDVARGGYGGGAEAARGRMTKKGERRVVLCSEVERIVFASSSAQAVNGEVGGEGEGEWKFVDMEDSDPDEGGIPIPANDEHGGVTLSSPSATSSDLRLAGMQRAQNRERVRQAARRGVVFGFLVPGREGDEERGRRRAEAVQNGRVVEASFAKGEWGVRWVE